MVKISSAKAQLLNSIPIFPWWNLHFLLGKSHEIPMFYPALRRSGHVTELCSWHNLAIAMGVTTGGGSINGFTMV